jgi:hypothetical protein
MSIPVSLSLSLSTDLGVGGGMLCCRLQVERRIRSCHVIKQKTSINTQESNLVTLCKHRQCTDRHSPVSWDTNPHNPSPTPSIVHHTYRACQISWLILILLPLLRCQSCSLMWVCRTTLVVVRHSMGMLRWHMIRRARRVTCWWPRSCALTSSCWSVCVCVYIYSSNLDR